MIIFAVYYNPTKFRCSLASGFHEIKENPDSGPTWAKRTFSMDAFEFENQVNANVYIHCDVNPCNVNNKEECEALVTDCPEDTTEPDDGTEVITPGNETIFY